MKTIVFTVLFMLMFPAMSEAKCSNRWSHSFLTKSLVSKLEKMPAPKWRIDSLFGSIKLNKKTVSIEIKDDGRLLIGNTDITTTKETQKRLVKLHQKVVCSKKPPEVKLLLKALKAFGININYPESLKRL